MTRAFNTASLTATLLLAVCGAVPAAVAQGTGTPAVEPGGVVVPGQGEPPLVSPFLLEPETQIKGDQIKRETFQSQSVGQNKNWDLDIGRFQPRINEDPNQLADDVPDAYSGMRLRLPFRGRTGQ